MGASAGGSTSCVRPWGLRARLRGVDRVNHLSYLAGAAHNLLRIVNLTKATGYDTRAIVTLVAVLPMATALSTDKSTVHEQFAHC